MIRHEVINPTIPRGSSAQRLWRRLAVCAGSALLALLVLAAGAQALTFTPGDVVVYRIGNGGSLTSAGAPVFLDEYSPSGTLLGSLAMPTMPVTPPAAGSNGALVASGSAGSEGLLTLSPDGTTLALTGYDAGVGTTKVASSAAASVPRTVGLVGANGTIDTSTLLTNVGDGNNVRSAVTDGNGNIWIGDASNGLSYATDGSSTATTLSSSKKNNNLRGVLIWGGQLYADADPTKDSFSFAQVGTGLPASGTPTFTTLIDGSIEPYGYALLSLGGGSAPDTLYTADQSTNSILKYSLVGGAWTAEGSIGLPAGVTGIEGLTANDVNGQAQIYATANGSSSTAGYLLSFTDTTGAGNQVSGIASQIATAPAGEAFRGIAFAPGTVIGSGGSGGTPVPAPEITTSDSGLEGSMNDPTNPTLGVRVSDPNYDASQLTVTAAFTNSGANAISAVDLTGSDGDYTLAVTPGTEVGEGVVTITASAPDSLSTSVQVPYGLSPFYGDVGDRYYADAGNASTEISVGDGFFIAGDDLGNVLRLYNSAVSGPPVRSFDFTGDLPDRSTSMDIESASEVDNGGTEDIYWVGSESNSSSGDPRPAANTVFETQVNHSGADTTLTYVGSYTGLRDDLINWDNAAGGPLGFATDSQGDAKSDTGFNIEGFEFAPGSTTTGYLAFRAPLETVNGSQDALIVPVTNFTSLIGASAGSAQFGQPIELNLGGLGIRELRKNADDQYLIIAGTADDSNSQFALYTWDGNPADPPTLTNTPLPSNQSVPSDTPVPDGADSAADAPYTGAWEGIVSVPDPLADGSSLELVQDDGDSPWYGDADSATSKSGLPTGLQKDLGREFEISLPAQAISFTSTAPTAAVYGGSYAVSATASSGLPVALSIDSSSDTGACSLSGGTVTFTGVGQCVIDANQGGNISWARPGGAAILQDRSRRTDGVDHQLPSEPAGGGRQHLRGVGVRVLWPPGERVGRRLLRVGRVLGVGNDGDVPRGRDLCDRRQPARQRRLHRRDAGPAEDHGRGGAGGHDRAPAEWPDVPRRPARAGPVHLRRGSGRNGADLMHELGPFTQRGGPARHLQGGHVHIQGHGDLQRRPDDDRADHLHRARVAAARHDHLAARPPDLPAERAGADVVHLPRRARRPRDLVLRGLERREQVADPVARRGQAEHLEGRYVHLHGDRGLGRRAVEHAAGHLHRAPDPMGGAAVRDLRPGTQA